MFVIFFVAQNLKVENESHLGPNLAPIKGYVTPNCTFVTYHPNVFFILSYVAYRLTQ